MASESKSPYITRGFSFSNNIEACNRGNKEIEDWIASQVTDDYTLFSISDVPAKGGFIICRVTMVSTKEPRQPFKSH